MISGIIAFIAKIGLGGVVDRTLDYMERKAQSQTDKELVRSKVEIEAIKAALNETKIMADLNKSKMEHQLFWWFVALFVGPLAIWWTAVIADSLFHFEWDVAALPSPLNQWAGDMIGWLFYVGSAGVGLSMAKGILKR